MTTSLGTSDLRTGGLIERLASPVASWLAASLFVVATVTAGVLESRVADGALRGPAALELAIPFASWWYALALFVVAAVAGFRSTPDLPLGRAENRFRGSKELTDAGL